MNLTFDVVQHSRTSSTLFAFDISSNDCFVVAQRHNTLDTTTGACQRQETATTAEKTAAAAAWSTAKSSTTDTKKREAEKTKQAADQRCTEHQDSLLCPVVALDLRLARNVNTERGKVIFAFSQFSSSARPCALVLVVERSSSSRSCTAAECTQQQQ